MASNTEGAWPIDPSTPEGLFRFELGDTDGTPHSPADGLADYGYLSDDVITALIAAYPDQPNVAMARAMTSMANQMIAAAQDIAVSDIKIKTIERAQLMLQSANTMFIAAQAADAAGFFTVVPNQSDTTFGPRDVEGTPASELASFGRSRLVGESGF